MNEALGDADVSDEGVFYMDITTYRTNFNETHLNYDTKDWNFGSFIMFDDQKTETVSIEECPNCTQHIVKVKNESD